MDNVYQWVTFYKAPAHTIDINHFGPSRFIGNPTLGTGTLFIAEINEVCKLTNGFFKCIKKTKTPLSGRLYNERI